MFDTREARLWRTACSLFSRWITYKGKIFVCVMKHECSLSHMACLIPLCWFLCSVGVGSGPSLDISALAGPVFFPFPPNSSMLQYILPIDTYWTRPSQFVAMSWCQDSSLFGVGIGQPMISGSSKLCKNGFFIFILILKSAISRASSGQFRCSLERVKLTSPTPPLQITGSNGSPKKVPVLISHLIKE